MNLPAFGYVALFSGFLLCQAGPASAADIGCELDRNNSIGAGDCLAQIHNAHDVELNEKYQAVLRALKSASAQRPDAAEVRAQLIAAQRNWHRFRDSDCKVLALQLPDDPSMQSRNTAFLLERTAPRVKEPDRWIAVVPPTAASTLAFSVIEPGQPSDDSTGTRCGVRQNQPVFFLAGSSGTAPVASTSELKNT